MEVAITETDEFDFCVEISILRQNSLMPDTNEKERERERKERTKYGSDKTFRKT